MKESPYRPYFCAGWWTVLLLCTVFLAGMGINQLTPYMLNPKSSTGLTSLTDASQPHSSSTPQLYRAFQEPYSWAKENLPTISSQRAAIAGWIDKQVPQEGGYWDCAEGESSFKCLLKAKLRG